MKRKSVQSINQWQSLPVRQAGVIQTSYDIIKAHGGELKVVSSEGDGSTFFLSIPKTETDRPT